MTALAVDKAEVEIGSYSLESLTTGMYDAPLHCVREYVQNSFDAIRAARADRILQADKGSVTIGIIGSAARPTLTVTDDGIGISTADAVRALVSIGASRKRSNVDAGFRGIGRLAGVAYCGTLRFTTGLKGEEASTVVEFDCGRMRGFMRPSAATQDVRNVIQACATSLQVPKAADLHGTTVEMVGLTGEGLEFAEIERLVPYLRQVCPVDYSDRFSFAERIRGFAAAVGSPLGTIDVETTYKRERTQILKAYDNAAPTAKPGSASTLVDVEVVSSAELGWFGWIGRSNFKGELTDDTVAGVRFRVKNIQIDGSDLIEDLASELTAGGTEGRLQRYAVGEVFITNPAVVPNARRDGFEDSQAWRQIRIDVRQKIARRVITLVREASNSRTKLKALAKEISGLENRVKVEILSGEETEALSRLVENFLARLKPEKLTGGDPDEVGRYVSRVKTAKERLVELKSRAAAGAPAEHVNLSSLTAGEDGANEEAVSNGVDEDVVHSGEGDAGRWSADEILTALRTIMIHELGSQQTEHLFALAVERLNSR